MATQCTSRAEHRPSSARPGTTHRQAPQRVQHRRRIVHRARQCAGKLAHKRRAAHPKILKKFLKKLPNKGKGVASSSHGSKRSRSASEEEHDYMNNPQQPLRRLWTPLDHGERK
ncbi:hypothetical protein HAX54_037466 [Datura stramonium]|uniref:Uncharacterized protein n=1 Tax=Datura stramonium TaxID=4076 RepID=A0ABS8SGZ5_DATST|nr:hypothetical protein [Datura stramonium]